MRKILVPMDGSGSAMRALACALTFGNVLKEGEIHLLNVRLPLMDFDIATGGDPSTAEQNSELHMAAGARHCGLPEAFVADLQSLASRPAGFPVPRVAFPAMAAAAGGGCAC